MKSEKPFTPISITRSTIEKSIPGCSKDSFSTQKRSHEDGMQSAGEASEYSFQFFKSATVSIACSPIEVDSERFRFNDRQKLILKRSYQQCLCEDFTYHWVLNDARCLPENASFSQWGGAGGGWTLTFDAVAQCGELWYNPIRILHEIV